MNIKTKFNIGDEVYFFYNNGKSPQKGIVNTIEISVYDNNIDIKYCLHYKIKNEKGEIEKRRNYFMENYLSKNI